MTSTVQNDWVETTLGEVADKIFSGGTPSTKREDFYGGNIPWLRTQEVDFNYIYDTEIKITEEGLRNSSARLVPSNSVIIAMYGNSAGRVAFSKIATTTNQACCNFVANILKADPYFIFFNLRGRYKEIEGMANGAAQQNLSVGGLKELKILLPSLPEQRAIAAVLSSLDDKIELLREQNKTLEDMAQELFHEWFVEFNFQNEDGNPYKKSGGKMIDSELGEIPKGWRVGKLIDLTDHIKESVTPSSEPNGFFSHYSIPAFDQGQRPESQRGAEILSNKYKVKNHSFLVSKLNPATPRIWTIFQSNENGVCSTEFQVIKPKKEKFFSFTYSMLNSEDFVRKLASKVQGTSSSHQRVRPQDIFRGSCYHSM